LSKGQFAPFAPVVMAGNAPRGIQDGLPVADQARPD
jgi:hypothetical protein